jgi:hypothetical protein
MKDKLKIKVEPKAVFAEYEQGNTYKASVGKLGIFEQAKRNERFFVGDQWHGAQCGNERPLVRNNVIKRIGEYKISTIGAAPVAVNYTAEGVPNTADIKKRGAEMQTQMMGEGWQAPMTQPSPVEISVIMDAMSSYFRVTAERLGFGLKVVDALYRAYISGSGIVYTYWDDEVKTGLYADEGRTTAITGDIAFDVLDVENVVFGDPNNEDIQSQPFILISQRLDVESVRREARRNGLAYEDIIPDGATQYNSGDRGEAEPTDSRRVTVITKLYKEWDKDDSAYKIMAVRVTEKATVRKPWNIGLTRYPLSLFAWEKRRSCIYGDSEITYLIPNQIAINRMLTSAVFSGISNGMPIMMVDNDRIDPTTKITNDPGQIIRVNKINEGDRLTDAVGYVTPPNWGTQYINAVNDLADSTLSFAGANDAALGNIRPDNATAIIQAREATLQPMQLFQNRFYGFIEDVARTWCDFWLNKYGNRMLKVETRDGVQYIPFNGERYKELVITARVDVGASTLWSEAAQISTLDAMFAAGLLDPVQYLENLPKGIIPKLTQLIEDTKKKTEAAQQMQSNKEAALQQFAEQYPAEYEAFSKQSSEEQELMLQQIMGGAQQ